MAVEKEITVETTCVFDGKIFEIRKDKAKLANGEIKNREVMLHPGGVAILAEKDDKYIFVKQFRYGAKDILFEIPAGKLDKKNEDILDAAKRELSEETGYEAKTWKNLGYIFSTPAICSEKIHLFYATDLTQGKPHPDDDEIIEFFEFDKNLVIDMIKNGQINDAKTLSAIARKLL